MNKKRAYFGGIVLTALLLIVTAAAIIFRLAEGVSLHQLRAVIESFGGMAPIIFILMCTARGLVFIPCGLLSALGGLLFGPVQGTLFTLIGLTAGSVITFYLARVLGKNWAQQVMGHRYDQYEGYISRDSFYSIFLMRVIPVLPFDAVSCIAGISRAGAGKYILATLSGSLPGVFIYVYFGDSVG
ncbi:MAG TPA: VTT domain-containing protein, partial [Candidatus Nitrosocosmicus sp.]|nr:VTT domain-containing protein [Candidatus Nitrosocosmicus sp.]